MTTYTVWDNAMLYDSGLSYEDAVAIVERETKRELNAGSDGRAVMRLAHSKDIFIDSDQNYASDENGAVAFDADWRKPHPGADEDKWRE